MLNGPRDCIEAVTSNNGLNANTSVIMSVQIGTVVGREGRGDVVQYWYMAGLSRKRQYLYSLRRPQMFGSEERLGETNSILKFKAQSQHFI